jgi:hypothetical protein
MNKLHPIPTGALLRVSPDSKYLFNTTGTKPDYSDVFVYWVRIDSMIDNLRA